MRISVTTENDIYPLEVAEDLELENFKALCEMEVSRGEIRPNLS